MGRMFLLMMLQPFNTLSVTMMPVYHPDAAEKDDAILFANNVREEMAQGK